jgi:hypothetical protein
MTRVIRVRHIPLSTSPVGIGGISGTGWVVVVPCCRGGGVARGVLGSHMGVACRY